MRYGYSVVVFPLHNGACPNDGIEKAFYSTADGEHAGQQFRRAWRRAAQLNDVMKEHLAEVHGHFGLLGEHVQLAR